MFLSARVKKLTVWTATIAVLQMTYQPAWADATTAGGLPIAPSAVADTTAEGYLQQIAQYTNATMVSVSNIPTYLLAITQAMVSWINPDTTNTTANLQNAFTGYYIALSLSTNFQPTYATALTADIMSAATTTNLPSANDVTYQTVLGTKFFNPDPRDTGTGTPTDSIYNYLKNASGGAIVHMIPSSSWNGTANDQAKYSAFYNTTTAVETYNAYVMSELASDALAGVPANQKTLTDMANGSNLFTQIASEGLGVVLRQILMFESQSFVVLTQMLQTQKQLLETQAMTNTLLMNSGVTSEGLLLRKAVVKTQAY